MLGICKGMLGICKGMLGICKGMLGICKMYILRYALCIVCHCALCIWKGVYIVYCCIYVKIFLLLYVYLKVSVYI